ncbi:hypothetical protein [Polaribacter sp. Hel1_85]|uniref:hypothetical protein n=1 Tax=Polaribacter sp. Hel1_85 TaxID=1250005 RepID=UPI00056BB876|nr:hypothetical protein [Polaribacter sp. Hel1_85]
MKKLILLTLLLISNYFYSQEDCDECAKKYKPSVNAHVDPCNHNMKGGSKYLDCLCNCKKKEFKQKIAKKENKQNVLTSKEQLFNYNANIKNRKRLKQLQLEGKTFTKEYKDLSNLVETYENLNNVSTKENYLNNRYSISNPKTSKNINKIKANSEKIDVATNVVSNGIYNYLNQRDERRKEENRKWKIEQAKKRETKRIEAENKKQNYVNYINTEKIKSNSVLANMSESSKLSEENLYKEILEKPNNLLFENYFNKFSLRRKEIEELYKIFKSENNIELRIDGQYVRKLLSNKITVIKNFYYDKENNIISIYRYYDYYKYRKFLSKVSSVRVSSPIFERLDSKNLKNVKRLEINREFKNIEKLNEFKNLRSISIKYSGNINLLAQIKNLEVIEIKAGIKQCTIEDAEYSLTELEKLIHLSIQAKKKLAISRSDRKRSLKKFKSGNKTFMKKFNALRKKIIKNKKKASVYIY